MKGKTWLRLFAVPVAVLAVGVMALTGFRAYAQGPGGPGMHSGMMKRMVSLALDDALTQAGVSPEQRTAVHAARDRAFAALDAQRPDPRARRDQMLALFEGDHLDIAQLQALHAQMEQHHQAVRDAITQAIVEIHDTLTPPQRKIVADYVRELRPMGHGPMSMR